MNQNIYEGISHIVYISTDIGTGCEHCSLSIGLDNFAESINHYIKEHAYKLLHIGMETSRDDNGNLWHSTVAVLGK